MNVENVVVVYENCEADTFKVEDIISIKLGDVQPEFVSHFSGISKQQCCRGFVIAFQPSADTGRIQKYSDVTRIILNYIGDHQEDFHVCWEVCEDSYNTCSSSWQKSFASPYATVVCSLPPGTQDTLGEIVDYYLMEEGGEGTENT